MNTVKESNLGAIKSVFNDNAVNSHYYKIITNTFSDKITNLEFAKPIIQVNQSIIVWKSNNQKPYLKYASLNTEKKQHIDLLIQDALNKMSIILKDNDDKHFLENIIEIPSEDAVFYTLDANNNINVILTEWGFTTDEHIKSEGFLNKMLSATLKSFIVKFKSIKDEFLEDINCNISSDNFNYNTKSNSEGIVKLNNLNKGHNVKITSLDSNFDEVNFIVNSSEEYTIIVNRTFNLRFNIKDSNNQPVKNREFIFSSIDFPNKTFQTDDYGFYNVSHLEKNGEFKLLTADGEELISENLPSEDKEYTIIYDASEDEILDEIDLESLSIDKEPIIIEFLNWKRKPIVNQSINIYGANGKENYITNNQGIIKINKLSENIECSIFMKYKGTDWKRDFIHTGNNKYTFIVKMKKFLWWWIPLFFLFFFLLLLIPTQVKHDYTVLNKNTKKPIKQVNISSTEPSVYKTASNYKNKTDVKGKLTIKYGKLSLYKQIFKKPNTDIFVSKLGYENLSTNVPLAYFKTRKSIIYLDTLKPIAQKPKKPIEKCNSGGDADKAGGNSLKEFDLKQDTGEFIFKYFTGNTHADIIRIYDCSKSEIRNNKPIWEIDEATVVVKSVKIPFTNRIITVEVIGRGNKESVWNYLVNCALKNQS